ncbi:alpha-1,6-mannosyltransferase [Saccharomycopsis crataegensis]|uniref:Alpha-1,6-mannosyltransferase n=1 Tax=Saccharomycopsis crataegensis TaxID=43959 RepID=A0AAV5QDX9_9ASCO|nr:alpha-1,6-mannosyltransferase [Saccharomycopsis crataegensis]
MKATVMRRVLVVIFTLISLVVLLIKFVPINSNNNLQKVLFESYLSSLQRNNEQTLQQQKQNEELSKKLEDIASNLLRKQEERINELEMDRKSLERKLVCNSNPPEDASLREKLAFIYPYDSTRKFPAYVWQCWKYGLNDDRFDTKFKDGETAWAVRNPGFVHELFNDDTSTAMVHHLYKGIPEIIEAYSSLPSIILKMDFFRYLILLARGGVYADIDTHPLQAVPNWIPENVSPNEVGMIVGIEADADDSSWKKVYARRLQFGQWVIQAKPGHPILREIVVQITQKTLDKKKKDGKTFLDPVNTNLDIMRWTGAGMWTDVIFTYFNDYVLSGIYTKVTWKDFINLEVPKLVSDVLVLPITSFSPGIGTMGSKDEDDPLAFVRHYFECNWKHKEPVAGSSSSPLAGSKDKSF